MAFFNIIVVLMLVSFGSTLGQRKHSRNIPVGADVKKSLNFDCPEEFGYYPHPADCTQYYVCVFGGALLESCTGGLMYSHELQTCDWPRNVGCDGNGEVTTPSVSYQSNPPSRSPEPKLRYTHPPPPPPIPPQPAAVVTSRGQPRQLHHNQQELVKQKQQQQLYVDTDEPLPPADEIENDRQQRVYRGQPSTVGQVQRDRDGLRQHTNAIPLSNGRGEKISITSFGTQQSLPEYRTNIDADDFIANNFTSYNPNRFKRQIGQSLNHGIDSRQFLPAHSYSTGHRAPSPTFQTTFIKGSPYRADISNHKSTVRFLPISSPVNNPTFKTIHSTKNYLSSSSIHDQNYQYFNLNQGFPQHSFNSDGVRFEKNADGFISSAHFSLSAKNEVPNRNSYRKLSSTELAHVSKRPNNVLKQYLLASTGKPESNDTFNILSFLNYFKPPPTITTAVSTTEAYATKKTTSRRSFFSSSRGAQKFPQQNNSFYDDYYDYYNETDYYYDDVHPLHIQTSTVTSLRTTIMTSSLATTTTKAPSTSSSSSSLRPTTSSGQTLSTARRIENKGIQAISTAAPKTIYNNSNHYDSSRYDSYYTLYDDDVDLYKDVEYAQHYESEPPTASPSPKQTYRGTPLPVTHQEKSPKLTNTAYIQNAYSSADDIYESAGIQNYNEDNYNNQDDQQNAYHETNKQANRGDRNDLNYIEEPATTKRITTTTTTTTVTTPRQYPTQKNVRNPTRYPKENEVRVQPTQYTLPEDPVSQKIPLTQKQTLLVVDVPSLPPIVNHPSPFGFSEHSTTPKTAYFHYITKTSKSTSIVSTTPPITNKPNRDNVIVPTTYSPPYFVRKSILRVKSHSIPYNWNSSENDKKLRIHPATINNELWSSTNVATEDNEEDASTESRINPTVEETVSSSTEHRYVPSSMTTRPVTDFNEVSTSDAFALDKDITNTSWLLLLERLNSITQDSKNISVIFPEVDEKSDEHSNFSLTEKPFMDTTKRPFSRIAPLPTRASRVNAAIKSVIVFGGPQKPYLKCGDNKTSTATCGNINQRVTNTNSNNRGRGSAHYTSSGRTSDNTVINRGTPPSRSRPTLKPSTSVIAKASEFVDIYRYLPRRPDPIYPQPLPDKTAAKCRKDVCLLPDCSCGGKEVPGDLPVEQVPQMVLLTYDDSVNDLNKGLYSDLFEKGRVNPNGCPIAATFYVSHEWTDYSQVQNLYSDGHEIASHTVSHSFGEQFSQKKWTKEVAGQREILSAYGGVHLEDVRGMRAPFLSVGGNKMFKMLYDSNFTYDSSMPIYENKPPSWPYTLDYKLFHDCMIPPCPTRSYPGVWEVPMVMWQDLNGGRCSMGDACSNPSDAEGVYKMIMKNFERHYTSNRAPFGLFYHAAWFTQPHHKEGFIQFLDAINSMKDVWLVTNWQAIQWVRDPTPVTRLNSFQPFSCNYPERPKRCNNPKVCNLWHKTGVRYMRTCQPCPDIYPWTGNTGIHSSRIDNDLED